MLDEDDDINDEVSDGQEEEEAFTLETFTTYFGQISTTTAKQLVSNLNDKAFLHSVAPTDTTSANVDVLTNTDSKRYDSHRFYGIMINTGALAKSTVGYD